MDRFSVLIGLQSLLSAALCVVGDSAATAATLGVGSLATRALHLIFSSRKRAGGDSRVFVWVRRRILDKTRVLDGAPGV